MVNVRYNGVIVDNGTEYGNLAYFKVTSLQEFFCIVQNNIL